MFDYYVADGTLSFNTQPPEGGWGSYGFLDEYPTMFQHTAARRRLAKHLVFAHGLFLVSTHSRPKAAGGGEAGTTGDGRFQHTAARRRLAP